MRIYPHCWQLEGLEPRTFDIHEVNITNQAKILLDYGTVDGNFYPDTFESRMRSFLQEKSKLAEI